MSELRDKLVDARDGGFDMDIEWIKNMFKVDNILHGTSATELAKYGGSKTVLSKLKTSLKGGIDERAISRQKRVEYFGSNELIEPPSKTLWEIFIGCFEDLTLKMLIVAAVASFIIGVATEGWSHGWYESVAIMVAIIIVVTITTVNDYSQAQQFKQLFRRSQNKIVKVMRENKLQEIDAQELVVGDIYEVNTGLIVPADSLLVEKHGKWCLIGS